MKESAYKRCEDLPLFLNANLVAKVLGVSPSSGYELMLVVTKSASFRPAGMPGIHSAPFAPPLPIQMLCICMGPHWGFPVLRIGSRMVVPKEQFIRWVEEHTGGAG